MQKSLFRLGFASLFCGASLIVAGCQTSQKKPEPARIPASTPTPGPAFSSTSFGKRLSRLGLNTFSANLHAHHFMDLRGSKKSPLSLRDVLTPGPCRGGNGTFPMDDGRPCRDENGETNVTIPPRATLPDGTPDTSDYFRQACEYATHEGELDVFFTTPHTKNNGVGEDQIVTSSNETELLKRHAMLASMNPERSGKPTFYCGLGQEASSISAGNHINILGQFPADVDTAKPFFFPTGDFRSLYTAVKARNDAGGKVFLQFNHPSVRRDLYFGKLADFVANKKKLKEGLNDYGLDDFGPVGCLTGKLAADTPECKDIAPVEELTLDHLKQTYSNIRAASGDPFRLIEVISPGSAKEGGDDETPGEEAFGPTSNTKTTFRAVHHRTDANTYEDGIYDWIYYLAMGFKIGPTANQDNHSMNYGNATASRTGILASDLRESTVMKALDSRRVFASEDKNTKIVLSEVAGTSRRYMGDIRKTKRSSTRLQIAYYDADGNDSSAKVRLYYYRANDPLDFGYRAPTKAVFHTIGFGPNNEVTLPAPNAEERNPNDLIPIQSGEFITLNLPLEKGLQWVFAEVIQDGDFDKTWSAPIWIDRK